MKASAILLNSLVAITAASAAQDAGTTHQQMYGNSNLRAEILMDNERIVVQKFVIPPGASEGNHTHPGNQLWIQMTPGEWTSSGRVSRLEAGSVGWQDRVDRAEQHAASVNAGTSPIELLWVNLKPHQPSPDAASMRNYRLVYPEIPGRVLLENDQVVVQRFVVEPGKWEGVHAHPGNQLYVHIKGGTWAVRTGGRETVSESKTGSIGWYRAIPLTQEHQSGNAGNTPIDLIWVTLKR